MLDESKFIRIHKNIFDGTDLVEEVENWANIPNSPLFWKQASTGFGTVSNFRSNQQCELNHMIGFESYDDHPVSLAFKAVHNNINPLIHQYRDHFRLELTRDEGWSINKYGSGAEYQPHFDAHPSVPRILSVVAFLSTPEDGGDLDFSHIGLSVPAENGTVVIFPSSTPFLHHATPVNAGMKYSLVTWLA